MVDSPLPETEAPKREPAKKRVEWGNVPQWISAIAAIVVSLIAIYALFFSSTSQMLVAYLHSELALRNSKIASLETQEHQLRLQIGARENELSTVERKLTELHGQLADLANQRDSLQSKVDEVGSNLSQAEFALVKEKIDRQILKPFVVTLELRLIGELGSDQGIRPRKEQLWTPYLNVVKSTVERLPTKEQEIGRDILRKMEEQCSHLNNVVIEVPAIKQYVADYNGYAEMTEQQRKKYEENVGRRDAEIDWRYKAVDLKIKNARRELEKCLVNASGPNPEFAGDPN